MFRHRFSVFQRCFLFACLALLHLVALPSLAQDEGLTFEQAQTRTSYARGQMDSMQRKLKDAEAAEKSALRTADELKKRYEEAKQDVEKATQARQRAEEQLAQARTKWLEEAERLKRIYDNRDSPRPAR